jgi:hypothetical protein
MLRTEHVEGVDRPEPFGCRVRLGRLRVEKLKTEGLVAG